MPARITFLCLCFVFTLTLLPLRAGAAELRWSEPLQLSKAISPDFVIASSPDFTVDFSGTLHTVWYSVAQRADEQRSGFSDMVLYRARVNGAWTPGHAIFSQDRPFVGDAFSTTTGGAGARNTSFELRANVLAGNDSQLHMVMGNPTSQWFLNAPLNEVVYSMTILPPWPLGQGARSQIAGSRDGTLYALLSAIPPGLEDLDTPSACTSCTDIFFRRSEDGGLTWSRPENLSRQEQNDHEPQLAVDAREQMHVIWERQANTADEPSAIIYRRSNDQGQSWQEPIPMALPGEDATQGVIAASSTNVVMVVYQGALSGGIFYQYSPDGGLNWSTPGLIPSVVSRGVALAGYARFSLAADGNGHIHLLMVGLPPAADGLSAQLLHLVWDGTNWSEPIALASGAPNPLGPRLLIERGNRLHALWFTSNPDPLSGADQQAVWYSEAALAAPELAPAATLTPLPTAVPPATPTVRIVPTATPLPLALREQATVDGPPLWELRGLQGVAMGLLAAGLLLALVAMLRLRRDRHL